MKKLASASAVLLATTAIAQADISRADPTVRLLFEDVGPTGTYGELSFGSINPKAGSNGVVPDPLASYAQPGFGILHRYSDQVSVALSYDTPFGADVSYPGFGAGGTPIGVPPFFIPSGGPFFGGYATVDTRQLTLMGRYEFGNGFSVHGGLRAMDVEGDIYTNVTADPTEFHRLAGTSEIGYGYLLGAAYERPEIALRVSLTYHSALEVDFDDASETPVSTFFGVATGPEGTADFSVEFPESWTLEFQSGIAADTLVFGSIHYEYWDGFNLSTDVGNYVNFTSDTTTYQVGLGRRLNENWSGSVSYTHRTRGTVPSDSSLSPTTGLNSIAVAAQYEMDAVTLSGGITYGIPGDQTVIAAAPVDFDDNEVIGVGLRIGFRF
ncbi:hypothetical protein P6F26_10140 [Roseibacterium sp. SDUM158017]|uniref:outer membrane protein transport protein n=1 Tax=Roseicyclus salinarum TaxID=3036773 RepID=UPI0024151082|nr:outer membrane protein transport protein [Roseibacterium sp. SDUM158017]MDG4648803.1 hypothetical protein [Roseibacterium sp. SDUM158017]